MDDISREVGISKKTLYQHITDKTDLVNKVIDAELQHTRDCFDIQKPYGKNAIDELFEVNRMMIEMMNRHSPSFVYDLKKYYPEINQRVLLSRRKGMYDSILANLKRGKKEGLYRKEVQEEIITKLQISRVENMYGEDMFSAGDTGTASIFRELFIYHIRGISNDKGIKYLEENMNKFDYKETEAFR